MGQEGSSLQVAEMWRAGWGGYPGSISMKGLKAPRGKLLRGGETTGGEGLCWWEEEVSEAEPAECEEKDRSPYPAPPATNRNGGSAQDLRHSQGLQPTDCDQPIPLFVCSVNH